MALGVALGAATGADGALAGDLSPTAGDLSVAAGTGAIAHGSGKLALGLDRLASEYLAFQRSVAGGTARTSAFAPTLTMAKVSDGAVTIEAIAADDPQALKSELQSLGAEITGVAAHLVSARLPLDRLSALEGLATLRMAFPSMSRTRAGKVTSQGDAAQYSDLARADSGASGRGIKVGVLSDSFDNLGGYASDVGTGDLPSGVQVLADYPSDGSDEGRAMAQIVHDVAPDAALAFNTAYLGQAAFAQGIRDLAAAGSKVIVDDVFYYAEPFFQDGVIAQAVDAVNAEGVAYFSAAGNDARQAYQAAFNGSGQTGPVGGQLHDFDPGPGEDTRLTVQQTADTVYVFQWSDPFYSVSGPPGAASDLDICFSAAGGTPIIGCSASDSAGKDPIEIAGFSGSGTLEISIERRSGPAPAALKLVAFSQGTVSFDEGYTGTNVGTVVGHANAAGAIAVGAAAYFRTPEFGVTPPVANYYSSAGNTPILVDTAGHTISQIRQKPEITAPDGGDNTFFGGDNDGTGWPNFYGTSAAAPHAAGIAALMRDVNPSLTPVQILDALETSAIDIQARSGIGFSLPGTAVGIGYDNDSGYGLIDARAAVASVEPPPAADLKIAGTSAPDPVVLGNSLAYTLTVANQGPDQAVNVVATDTLPAGVTLVSTTGCNNDRTGVPTCNLGNIASGGVKRYTVAVNVGAATRGSIVNTASVTSDTADPDTTNNSATQSTKVNLFGDQDGDNCIGSADVNKVLGAVRAKSGVLATQDINRDGAVNLADPRALMQLYTNSTGVCP